MKTQKIKLFAILLSIGLLTLTSCNKDEETTTEDASVENLQKSSEIETLSDEVSNIIEGTYIVEENISAKPSVNTKSANNANYLFPDCLTKTVEINGMTRTITLDFGSGCDLENGNHLSGIITIVYERNPLAMSRTITYSFSNFYFNNKNIEGGGSILRELSNNNGNPQATIQNNITITWPNGVSAHHVGERVREWITGFGSGSWGDNVFLITGHWTTEFPNGNVNTSIITSPLRRELSCRFIVSGTISISNANFTGVLDFGDGDCDNQATFTNVNGNSFVISLN